MTSEAALAETFETQRVHLRGLAYRMLGSLAEADDIVQEAWLRWREVQPDDVAQPRAFLAQTVTRLCLDHLKSARQRRETYVGPWLPEPLVQTQELLHAGADAATEFASDLTYAFMLALETLSPLERAAFLLHDVFDEEFSTVARLLERSEPACRQLATRARHRVRNARRKSTLSLQQIEPIARAFASAVATGDLDTLKQLLAEDVQLLTDGGGRVPAAGIPLQGRARVVKFLHGVTVKHPLPGDIRVRWTQINGSLGCIVSDRNGSPIQTVALDVNDQRQIYAIYITRNPQKLWHL